METVFVEAVQSLASPGNWGKFCVARFTGEEWAHRSVIDTAVSSPLLRQCGWGRRPEHIWVMDLQTGEAAYFRPGGSARADLNRHRVWVCVLFEEFLNWLYQQDLTDLSALPPVVELPAAEFGFYGCRRPGPHLPLLPVRAGR
jgi:hypothetical protein